MCYYMIAEERGLECMGHTFLLSTMRTQKSMRQFPRLEQVSVISNWQSWAAISTIMSFQSHLPTTSKYILCYLSLLSTLLLLCFTLVYFIYYTILYYTILYYTILYYTILYYTILYYTILYYTILYYTILYYTLLYSVRPLSNSVTTAVQYSEILFPTYLQSQWTVTLVSVIQPGALEDSLGFSSLLFLGRMLYNLLWWQTLGGVYHEREACSGTRKQIFLILF